MTRTWLPAYAATLVAMLAESAAGPVSRAAIVTGAAGIGKSRFARELAMLAAERGKKQAKEERASAKASIA